MFNPTPAPTISVAEIAAIHRLGHLLTTQYFRQLVLREEDRLVGAGMASRKLHKQLVLQLGSKTGVQPYGHVLMEHAQQLASYLGVKLRKSDGRFQVRGDEQVEDVIMDLVKSYHYEVDLRAKLNALRVLNSDLPVTAHDCNMMSELARYLIAKDTLARTTGLPGFEAGLRIAIAGRAEYLADGYTADLLVIDRMHWEAGEPKVWLAHPDYCSTAVVAADDPIGAMAHDGEKYDLLALTKQDLAA